VDALLRGGCRDPRTTGALVFVLPRPALLDDEDVLLFDMYVEEYAIHRVLRQFGHYQEWPAAVVHTVPSAHRR
jgi:hypothetical protein